MKNQFFNKQVQRFSIRKYSLGAVSVLLGTLLFAGTQTVAADQVISSTGTDSVVSTAPSDIAVDTNQYVSEKSNATVSSDIESETKNAVNNNLVSIENGVTSEVPEPLETENKATNANDIPINTEPVSDQTSTVNEKQKTVEINPVIDDPTNPKHLVTRGYAASNVDKPATSIVNDVSRRRATKEEKTTLKTTVGKVANGTGHTTLLATGNGSIARGDDYPVRFKNLPDYAADDWGLIVKNCTSFTAYRLSSVNGFNIPRAYGNGGEWGYRARREGYRVDNHPALGSVAWIDDGSYGHVAWVSNVLGNNVEIEEYNYAWSKSYNRRVVAASSISGFIHFKDIIGGTSTPISQPSDNQGIPASGVYHFTQRASIKAEPKMSSPELAYYDAGQTVTYDRKLEADGHQWISYLSFAGNRRYIAIGVTKTKAPLKGTLTIQNNNAQTGTFDVIVSDVSSPYGVKEVKLPTWSSENGQDDIVWYTAAKQPNGTYKITVNANKHKGSTGEYNIHLYYVQNNGEMVGAGGTKTTVSIKKPEGKITIQNNNPKTGTFDVVISNISNLGGVKEVKVPTWSSANDQDDIIWYTPKRQSDGTYKLTIKASDHKYSTGKYNVHLYYVQNNGQMICVTGTTTEVSLDKELIRPTGTITIRNNTSKTGTFDIIVSNVSNPGGIKEVKVPTWSAANDQDDVVWYTASKQPDGTYKQTVKVSDHKNSTGKYNVHLYYVQDDGKLVGAGSATTEVSLPAISIPSKGNYVFQGYASIRSEAKISSPELANFDKGSTVFYDQTFIADGHQWISYVGYSGSRRYVAIN